MLRETRLKLKFKALAKRLGSEHRAVSALEMLWHATAQSAPDGAIGRYSDAEIEAELDWEGEPGALIAALVEFGWLDKMDHQALRLFVHDWHEHADHSTHRKLARARLRFANGAAPRVSTLPKEDRNEAADFYASKPSRSRPTRKQATITPRPTREQDTPALQGLGQGLGLVGGLGQGQEGREEAAPPPRAPDPPWGPLANLLGPCGVSPAPEPDEKRGWLETYWPEICAAAESEVPPEKVAAKAKSIAFARWRTYVTTTERRFIGHGKREAERLASEQFAKSVPRASPEEAEQLGLRATR